MGILRADVDLAGRLMGRATRLEAIRERIEKERPPAARTSTSLGPPSRLAALPDAVRKALENPPS